MYGAYVFCECGCGQRTRLATQTERRRGRVKGQPARFVPGHNLKNWPADFWEHVGRGPGCREWTGRQRHPFGYGVMSWNGRNTLAHRLAWELTYGPIPPGKHVLHRCDNPPCCEPSHLFLGTNVDNQVDKVTKGRQARGETIGTSTLTTAQAAAIRGFLLAGYPQREIAGLFACAQSHIGRIGRHEVWVTAPGGGAPRGARHGSRHGMAKLTEDNVRAIRALVAAGERQKDVGELFGVSFVAISDISRGRRWGHVQ